MPTYTQKHRIISIATPLGEDVLLLQSFSGEEGISTPFRFDLRLHSEDRNIKFDSIVGKPAVITIKLADGSPRYIHGIISQFTQGGASLRFAHYSATLVPWLWLLTRTSDCRIFQNKTAPDIIQQIFKEYGFADYKLRLHGTPEEREYCVQYRETDFNFVSRLMEEEGIFYFFEHERGKHTLVLANSQHEFKDCPQQPTARYEMVTHEHWLEDLVTGWSYEQEVTPGAYTIGDYNFLTPQLSLEANIPGQSDSKYEIYDYPGEYQKKAVGDSLVSLRMEEEDAVRLLAKGTSTCRAFSAGFKFKLKGHYRADLNREFALTNVSHLADQGDDYETSSGAEERFSYENTFDCIPHPTPYRPRRKTPVPVVHGSQTAIVVGRAGEEIDVDEHGRVKVQFHWDREGKYNEESSCRIRVSQNWAGARWGAMFLPRIGQEVIVDFLEGNPDQPIITGRVYNGESMPPYTLPDHQTKSTIKSYSSKGGGGFNEIRFEDKKGEEQLFLHGEKDMDVRVKNDRREWIGRDRSLIVKRDKKELIERDEHIIIKRDQIEKIERDHHLEIAGKEAIKVGGSHSFEVSGSVAEKFGSSHSEEAAQSIYIKGGMTVVIEAGVQLTIKAGSSFVDIGPAGVTIQGTMVLINSGGAAGSGSAGTLVSPTKPEEAEIADNADPGDEAATWKNQRAAMTPAQQAAFEAPTHNEKAEENKEKKSWIEIVLEDEDGKPVSGEKYRVTLPDGSTLAEGTLDEKGFARVNCIDPGQCKITFPNFDKDAWEPK